MLFQEPSGTIPSVADAADQRGGCGTHGPVPTGHHHVTAVGRRGRGQRARIVALGQHAQSDLQPTSPQLVDHGLGLGPLHLAARRRRLTAGRRVDQQQDGAPTAIHYGEPSVSGYG